MAQNIPPLSIRILGSGTSTGVPVLGCNCDICKSDDPKDKRTRASILVTRMDNGRSVVVDTSPDFRAQMLAADAAHTEAVLYTHTHADHLHGFDDLRTLYFTHKKPVQIYIHPEDRSDLVQRFSYAFEDSGYLGMPPQVELSTFDGPFDVLGLPVDPVRLPHGSVKSSGFRIGRFAYATDFKTFPDSELKRWQGKIDTLVISGLRFRPHHTHSSIEESIEISRELQAKRTVISHLNHEVSYQGHASKLPDGFEFAFDGLVLNVD